MTRRPRSLVEVVEWSGEPGTLDSYLREFLDTYYVCDQPAERQAMLREAPALTRHLPTDAYLAAVAEHLAHGDGQFAPAWVDGPERFLKRPFFPCGLESLKARLLVESPTAFRRRMIFVDFDPLYRPRRRTPPVQVLSA